MAEVLPCCSPEQLNQPYIGVDQTCHDPAIFCIVHSPHKTAEGLLHQMLPLKQFKKTLHQKKFKMNEKVSLLTDQYNSIMDSLIQQIKQLKLRKNIELSMLWLRQLAKNQEQYEIMRQIYRMDFKGLTCSLVHDIYFKILHNQILQTKSVAEIDCYKGISQVLQYLSHQKHTKSFLSKKIAQIQGVLQNGQILKRALPDKIALKGSIKEVLLQSPFQNMIDLKYNKCAMIKNCRQYVSIFSKYPLLPHLVYHMTFNTKYTNVMLGVCSQNVINPPAFSNKQNDLYDRHYNKQSIVFNCTNGCLYRDGMFESGSNHLTKGRKQLILKLRITQSQLIITFGKHVVCRTQLSSNKNKLFMHVLLRTEGDSFQVDRDKDITSDQNSYEPAKQSQAIRGVQDSQQFGKNMNYEQRKARNQQQAIKTINIKEQFQSSFKEPEPAILDKKLRNQQKNNEKTKQNINRREELQKQKVLNQFLKKQRMDKILSELKSKPIQKFQKVRPPILKIKQARQQFINSNINIVTSQEPTSKRFQNNKKSQNSQAYQENSQDYPSKSEKSFQPHIQVNKPNKIQLISPVVSANRTYQLYGDESFHFQDLKSNNQSMMSPIAKINDLMFPRPDPNKNTSNLTLNIQKVQNSKGINNTSNSFLSGSIQKSTQIMPTLMGKAKNSQKLKPQQKSFKLCQQQSFHFQDMKSNYDIPLSPTTPISKMNELFDFQKKDNEIKKSLRFPKPQFNMNKVYEQAKEDSILQKSGANYDEESEVISAQSVQDEKTLANNINKNMVFKTQNKQIPELRHTHFSKMSSKQKFADYQSSVNQGQSILEKPVKIQPKLIRNKGLQQNQRNPMQLMNIMESAIGVKSNSKKSLSQMNVLQDLRSDVEEQAENQSFGYFKAHNNKQQVIPIKINSPRKTNKLNDSSSFSIRNTENNKESDKDRIRQSQIRITYNKSGTANDSWL